MRVNMKNKKYLYLIVFLLLCILSISAASAADDASNMVSADTNQDINLEESIPEDVVDTTENEEIISDTTSGADALSESQETTISSNDDEDVLGATKSFKDLYNSIYANGEFTTAEITLNDNYEYKSGDSGYTWHGGINIKKTVTIHGNGHTIDCKNQAIGFTLTNKEGHFGHLTIYDLNIINGQEQDTEVFTGGAIIVSSGTRLTAQNCNFTNCKAYAGGAIMTRGGAAISLTNCVFSNNRGTYGSYDNYTGGGAIWGVADSVTITNCAFNNNYAPTEGGAIDLYETPTTIKNCNFTGNTVNSEENLGAALYIEECSSVTIENCNFNANVAIGAKGEGAAICTSNINTLTITGSNFTNNNATSNGAAISSLGGNMNIRDCTFKDNIGGGQGGAIWTFNVTLSIINSNFIANAASGTYGGGAIYFGGSRTLNISNSRFTNNKAKNSNNGGALYIASATLNITGSSFGNNSAAAQGGAIYQTSGSASITNSNFTNNAAGSNGGALLVTGLSSTTITGANFSNNAASGGGGAILSTSSPITIKTSTFNGNHGNSGGGAIYTNANLDITGSSFSNNDANDANAVGGAIRSSGSTLNIVSSNFTGNKAEGDSSDGGAIYASSVSNFNIKTSSIKNSTAKMGGAIYASSCGNVKIENSDISSNSGTQGGAIYSVKSGLTIKHSTVNSNQASAAIIIFINNNANKNINVNNVTFSQNNGGSYGALYLHDTCTATIVDSRFNTNVGLYGGAIYGQGGTNIIVRTSNFTGNTAGWGGGIYTNASTATVSDSTFTGNTGALGGAIYIIESSTLNVAGTTFNNNVANVSSNGRGGGIYSAGSTATINASIFNGNSALDYGAGIYAQSTNTINVYNSNFTNNKVYGTNSTTGYGGGICLVNAGDFNVNGCRFADNFANYVAAAIFAQGTNLNVGNSVFDNNDNRRYGVYATGTQINSSIFSKTTVGGGIAVSADCRNMTASSFTISQISDGYCDEACTFTITESHGYTGTVNVTIGSSRFTVNLNNGAGMFNGNLNIGPGTYKAIIDFHETGDYYSSYAESNEFTLKIRSDFSIVDIQNVTIGSSTFKIWVQESHRFTGVVNLTVGPRTVQVSLNNGQGSADIPLNFGTGAFKAILNFPGSNNYSAGYAESNEFCIQYITTLNIANISNGTLGEPIIINVTESHLLTLDVNVEIGSKTYPLTISNGEGILTITDLAVGEYQATIDFPGSNNCTEYYADSNRFYVKYDTAFTIANIQNALYGDSVTINVTEANGYSGNVNVKIGSKTYQVTLNNGNGIITVNDIAVGTYKAIIDFQETNTYNAAHAESNEFLIKYQPEFAIADIPNTILGDPITIKVTESHNLNGTVAIAIGSFEDTITLNNGVGTKTISYDFAIGTYKVTLNFAENDKFISGSAESNEFLIKAASFADLYELIRNGGSSITLEHDYVFDEAYDSAFVNGIPITGNIAINGNNHIIDGNGRARIFDISNGADVTIENIQLIKGIGENGGAIMASADTEVIINNAIFSQNTASASGGAIYSEGVLKVYASTFKNNTAESGSISANNGEINDTEFIDGDTVLGEIPVSPDCVFLTDPVFIIASIPDTNVGSPIEIKISESHELNGTVTINIDGTTYDVEINNGIGNLTIESILVPGIYKATLNYIGVGNFSSATAESNSFKVGINPEIKIGDIANFEEGNTVTIKVTAVEGFSGELNIAIGGATYAISMVNGSGEAIINNLKPGTYKATISYPGDETYSASTAESNSFTVTAKPVATSITAKAVSTVYNGGKYIVAVLKDKNGKALSGLTVQIKINGKTKTLKTDKNGQVKLTTNGLVPKTYTAAISFSGNNNYLKSSKSVKVTVKKANPKLTAKAKTFKLKVKVKKYTATLKTNQNKVMKNTKVTLKVNKKTFSAKTNKKGIATFKITNLKKKGKFTAVITYGGNKYYNKVTKKVGITVKN